MLFATSKGQRASVAPLRVAPGALPPPLLPSARPRGHRHHPVDLCEAPVCAIRHDGALLRLKASCSPLPPPARSSIFFSVLSPWAVSVGLGRVGAWVGGRARAIAAPASAWP